jgi:transcriptional regulator
MYNPRHFSAQDLTLALQAISENPLGLLIGPDERGASFGTHVPLTAFRSHGVDADGFYLEGHMARANPHWTWLSSQTSMLAVFNVPGAYVSPTFYDSEQNVPTWNYIAVHAYGDISLIDDPEGKDKLLKRLIGKHEPAYAAQWRGLPADYQQKLLSAIVGFRIQVTSWEAKFKLSQNRPAVERTRIKESFAANDNAPEQQALARWMEQLGL